MPLTFSAIHGKAATATLLRVRAPIRIPATATATTAIRQEVDELREYMKELSYQSLRTEMSLNRLSEELREFKDEMREFKDAMRAFKDEAERDRKRMNKQWGDLANRLGTLVEDIVAPSLPRVAAELSGCGSPDFFAVRVVRRRDGDTGEYDALLACNDIVLVNETKSRLQASHVEPLLRKLAEVLRFCPEHAGKRLVGVLATLYPDDSVIRRATAAGVLVMGMGMGDEAMQVMNPDALETRDPA